MSEPFPALPEPLPAAPPEPEPAPSPQTAVVWLACVFLAAAVALAVGLAAGVRGNDVLLLLLGIAITVTASLPLILDQARRPSQRHLLLTLLSISYAVAYGVPVATQWLPKGEFPGNVSGVPFVPPDIAAAQAAALGGLLCLFLGYALPFGAMLSHVLPRPTRDWTPTAALGVACAMIPLGWLVFLSSRFGFLPAQLGSGFLGAISSASFFGIALLTILFQRHGSRAALLLLALLIPPTMVINFFTGSKQAFFSAPVMVALTYLAIRRRIPVRWIAAGMLALVLFYPISHAYREDWRSLPEVLADPVGTLAALSQRLSDYPVGEFITEGLDATTARLDVLSITAVIMRDTPHPVPFQGGWTLGYIALSYVPRALWPGKPALEFGQFVTDNYGAGGHVVTSTGAGWIGELYMNFGISGIVTGMLVMGLLLRIAHECLFRPEATLPVILAGVIVIYVVVPQVGGNLMAPINGTVFNLFPLLLAHPFVRTLGQRPAPLDFGEAFGERGADGRLGI